MTDAKHIDLLDYARGVAIIAVVLFHTLTPVYGYSELPWDGWIRAFPEEQPTFLFLLPCWFGGAAGVALFFVISGFCIHISFQKLGQSWCSFFIRRFFRIYPAYLAALCFSALMLATRYSTDFGSWETWKQLLMHLFLVHNLNPDTLFTINAPFWSLAVEVQLYLLYPLLLFLTSRLGWRRVLLVLAVTELSIRSLDAAVQTINANNTVTGHVSAILSESPFGFWFSWSIGAFLAENFLKKQPLLRVATSPGPWASLAFISYFIKPLYAFEFLWCAILAATVISKLLNGDGPKIKLPAAALKTLKHIGLWSYSLYLLHWPILNASPQVIMWLVPLQYRYALLMFSLFPFVWAVIIIGGLLWYRTFELPPIALGKRLSQKFS